MGSVVSSLVGWAERSEPHHRTTSLAAPMVGLAALGPPYKTAIRCHSPLCGARRARRNPAQGADSGTNPMWNWAICPKAEKMNQLTSIFDTVR